MNLYRNQYPFEYCAIRYLLQWLRSERKLHEAISKNPSDKSVREALGYFRVARNFKGLGGADCQIRSVRERLMVLAENDRWTSVEKVEKLTKFIERKYGQRNLSAASKLLWLACRNPLVIYDNRAVAGLAGLGHQFKNGDYAEYCRAWRSEYEQAELKITAAVQQLPRAQILMPPDAPEKQELLQLVNAHWFKERVFDIFLWEIAGGA